MVAGMHEEDFRLPRRIFFNTLRGHGQWQPWGSFRPSDQGLALAAIYAPADLETVHKTRPGGKLAMTIMPLHVPLCQRCDGSYLSSRIAMVAKWAMPMIFMEPRAPLV